MEADKEVLGSREEQIGSLGLANPLSTERMNTNILQHSIGNCTQYSVIIHNGKDMIKNVYVHRTESLSCSAEIGTIL